MPDKKTGNTSDKPEPKPEQRPRDPDEPNPKLIQTLSESEEPDELDRMEPKND